MIDDVAEEMNAIIQYVYSNNPPLKARALLDKLIEMGYTDSRLRAALWYLLDRYDVSINWDFLVEPTRKHAPLA